MRRYVLTSALAIIFILSSCIKQHNFLHSSNRQKLLAIQPLGDYDTAQLNYLSRELNLFYGLECVILKPMEIPPSFRMQNNSLVFSADSIIQWLSLLLNEDIVEVVGLTHYEIHTYKPVDGEKRTEAKTASSQSIFGLGFQPGQCCIISDFKLRSNDSETYNRRLRSVVLHETGHNLGLKHCSDQSCLMWHGNGRLQVLTRCCMDFCPACLEKL